ncbi:MMPL family transporter [Gordonia sp. ABSL49_1]|uniref:MMPL family transporter n=1 Tax=Gordonia sp. ABSL49_1 TaxID=2920941 RepID=UPI001F0CFB26|nr:MMPL family transporter [Gordonia sp. ABSL49_1]MCH5641061.1 MMPL family transporter [Gordonia sp. ABSL49_1]
MALALYRLGRFAFRKKWWFIAAWLVALFSVGAITAAAAPKFATDFELPNTDSDRAMSVMKTDFPAFNDQLLKSPTTVVIAADDGLANHEAQIYALVGKLRALPHVVMPEQTVNPVAAAAANPKLASLFIGDNGKVGLIKIQQDIPREDLTVDDMEQFKDILAESSGNGLQVEGTGALMQVQEQGGAAELLGFAIAFVVMIVAFGALVAAFIPIITGIVGVGLTMLLVTLSAKFMDVQQSATAIITMLGIAVSIDYALFIVSRYRSELNIGGTREAAAGRAVGTAGSAVVFAGLTVMVAVAALSVVGIPFITQMGIAASFAVLIAVLGAITLIPALLGAFGRFAFKPRIPGIRHGDEPDDQPSNGLRVGRFITRYPLPVAIIGLVLLAVAAGPMTRLELGMDTTSDAEYSATALLQRGFGEGVNGELFVVVTDADGGNVAPAADAVVAHAKTLDNVANPSQITWVGNGPNPANSQEGATAALITVTPEKSPSGPETHTLMDQLRDYAKDAPNGATVNVGGQTAILSDISDKLSSALIPFLLLVVGLAFIILMVVFRSILVPLTATIGFLFSVCATFGATVLIFQEGYFGLIEHTKPVISFLPIFLIGVVFGLAMDYQVFLVTRMREEYVHGVSAKDSVIIGYQHGARVVTSAALIMISVFAAFMLAPDTIAKMMGFALAAAVFFDAFVIRMMVVPAVTALMGDAAWKLPRWLDKILPNVDVEGTAIREIPIEDSTDPTDERKPAPTPA